MNILAAIFVLYMKFREVDDNVFVSFIQIYFQVLRICVMNSMTYVMFQRMSDRQTLIKPSL
jgi:hypothetical protein